MVINGHGPRRVVHGHDHGWSSGWWFGTFFIFPYIGNVIIPTDELIFFRGVGIPPTSHPVIDVYELLLYNLLMIVNVRNLGGHKELAHGWGWDFYIPPKC